KCYKWFYTLSLKQLAPLYVSSVDSGNLAGHLMTLRAGLLALADERIVDVRAFEGLGDTVRAFAQAWGDTTSAALGRILRDVDSACDARPATLETAQQWIARIEAGIVELPAAAVGESAGDAAFWIDALARQCRAQQQELADLAGAMTGAIPTLRELAAREAQSPAPDARRPGIERLAEIERLARQCSELARMHYDFLYDPARHLLAIGYNVAE